MLLLKQLFTPPKFAGDGDKTIVAQSLHVLLLVGLFCAPVASIVFGIIAPSSIFRVLVVVIPIFLVLSISWALVQRGQVRLGALLVVWVAWAATTLSTWLAGGLRGALFGAGWVVIVVLAGFLLGRRSVFVFVFLNILAAALMAWSETQGWVPAPPRSVSTFSVLISFGFDLLVAAAALYVALNSLQAALQNSRKEIDERRRVEQALRASAMQYRLLVEDSPEGIFIVDDQGQIAMANPAAGHILGYPANELMGKNLLTFVDADELARWSVKAESLLNDTANFQEHVFVRRDKKRIQLMGSAKLMPDGRFQYIFRDVTEDKEIEQILARRATELRLLYQASLEINAQPDVGTALQMIVDYAASLMYTHRSSLYLMQPDQTLELRVAHNIPAKHIGARLRRGEGLAGRVIQEGKPLMVDDYETWDDRAVILEDIRSRRTLCVPLRTRNRFIGALNVIDTEQSGSFSEDEVHLLSLFADQAAIAIENAQLYQQAQQRAEQLATMNQIGRAVSALQDLDSVLEIIYRQVQRIAPVDAFYIGLYDAEREMMNFPIMYDSGVRYHESALPLRPDTWLAQVIRESQPFILHRTAEEMQTPLTHGLGNLQRKSASILIVPLFLGEHVIGALSVQSYTRNAYSEEYAEILIGIGHQAAIAIENAKLFTAAQQELQERRRIEIEREALIQELESKNAELERFTYTVSHDLKSPLITIRGFLGFLEKDALERNIERLNSDIGRISEATEKMQRLLNDLLELSRIGRLKNPSEKMSFDLIAHEAVELVHGRLMERGIQISIAENMPSVYGDHMRLVEVVQNLVDNAAKFMGSQPHPQIEIGAQGVDTEGKPIFFVRDNGIGIDPQYHAKVFGLFDKLDPLAEGTGVGLTVAKRVIEVHNGRIWIESEGIGRGTTFCFTLPASSSSATAV